MEFLRDVTGIPILLVDHEEEIIEVIMYDGSKKKIAKVKKFTAESFAILREKIKRGVITAEDLLKYAF